MSPVPVACSFEQILYDPSKESVSQNTLPSRVVKEAVVAYEYSAKLSIEIIKHEIQNSIFFIYEVSKNRQNPKNYSLDSFLDKLLKCRSSKRGSSNNTNIEVFYFFANY